MSKTRMVLAIGITCLISLGLVLTITSCGTKTAAIYQFPEAADFSQMTWTDAFNAVVAKMEREYGFTQWKGVGWKTLGNAFRPAIEQAQASGNFEEYYLAMKEFLAAIPDGHVNLKGDDRGVIASKVGGGFGMLAMKLDDGRIVAASVTPGGPADAAGMKAGAELVAWGGIPADQALADTSTLFARNSQATDEDVAYQKLRFLVRAPIGATEQVAFKNQGEAAPTTVTLTAIDDGMEPLVKTEPIPDIFAMNPDKLIDSQVLSGNIGYIHVLAELDLTAEDGSTISTADLFKQAVDSFIDANVAGIIIDVQGNVGGLDVMVTQFMSNFYKTKTLYEYGDWYNAATGKFELWMADPSTGEINEPGQALYIQPGSPVYEGPVAVLVDSGTVSSGEGIALAIRNLPNGQVIGFRPTNGSFGMAGDTALMPEGLKVTFPYGRTLDKDKHILLDSQNGVGGVAPTSRVPMTLENALKWGAGENVEVEYAVGVEGIRQRQKAERKEAVYDQRG